MKRRIAIEIISFLFIFLFVYAGFSKLLDVEKFRIQIGQSPVLAPVAPFATWFIPFMEVIISVLLVIPRYRLIGLLGSFGMMVMFTAYIISILRFSEHIPCSCGGVLQALGWTEHLIFNLVFILLAAGGIILLTRSGNGGHSSSRLYS